MYVPLNCLFVCMYVIFVCLLESAVSFESTRYEVEEGEGHVELTIALTEAVPFNNTSLQLRAIDDTTTTTITTTGVLRIIKY